jgi:hypothetical protein
MSTLNLNFRDTFIGQWFSVSKIGLEVHVVQR